MLRNRSWPLLGLGLALALCGIRHAKAGDGQSTVGAPLIIDSDFEDNSLGGWIVSGNSPTVQSSIKRSGRYAMRSELDRANSPVPFRTEVSTGGKEDVQYGQEYWYAFSIYLPEPYPVSTTYEIVAQWHGVNDEGEASLNPPMSLQLADGGWVLSNYSDERAITVPAGASLHGTNYAFHKNYDLGAYVTNAWTDWVFRIRWAYNAAQGGSFTVWKNGMKALDVSGPNCFNDLRGPYFKMGIYKGWKDRFKPADPVSKRVVYHDSVRIAGPGGTYNDVASKSETVQPLSPTNVVVQ